MIGGRTIWNGLKVAFLIIGTTIGAGYASGREIWEFFTSYGESSQFSIIVSMVLFSLSCYIILSISHRLKSPNYVQVLEEIIGKRLAKGYDLLIFLYLISTTVVMFAGSGATLSYWNQPYWIGVLLIAVLTFVVFLRDVQGVMSLNSVLIPFLITTLITVCLIFLTSGNQTISINLSEQRLIPTSIAFTALNILPLIAVLSAVGSKMGKQEIKIASIASAIGLCTISVLYNQSLLLIGDAVLLHEVPLFSVLSHFSAEWLIVVSIVLWLAIYTTAVSNTLGLVSRFKNQKLLSQWMVAGLIIIFIIPLTAFGFSNLIRILYPLYGVLNLFILAMILLYPLANANKLR